MSLNNHGQLIGRLVEAPVHQPHDTDPKKNRTWMRIASDRIFKSKEDRKAAEDAKKQTADFFGVTLWGKQADNAAEYLEKGQEVTIGYRLQSSIVKDSDNPFRVELVATEVRYGPKSKKGQSAPSEMEALESKVEKLMAHLADLGIEPKEEADAVPEEAPKTVSCPA